MNPVKWPESQWSPDVPIYNATLISVLEVVDWDCCNLWDGGDWNRHNAY
uniref:Uncharacterized protein n=1 Tax=Anguilla anguilla TaxID=7936 RepID=A0A0E9RTZ1_ANGAN